MPAGNRGRRGPRSAPANLPFSPRGARAFSEIYLYLDVNSVCHRVSVITHSLDIIMIIHTDVPWTNVQYIYCVCMAILYIWVRIFDHAVNVSSFNQKCSGVRSHRGGGHRSAAPTRRWGAAQCSRTSACQVRPPKCTVSPYKHSICTVHLTQGFVRCAHPNVQYRHTNTVYVLYI